MVRAAFMLALFLLLPAGATLTGCATAGGGSGGGSGGGCCKICTTGKPCGNTCIARSLTCHVGRGCAC